MRFARPTLPTVLSALALAFALATYAAPRAAGSAETTTPATRSDSVRAVENRALLFTPAARIKALEDHSDEQDAKIQRLEHDLAVLSALKSHSHTYSPSPGFGIVNLPTLRTMMDRMDPSDRKATFLVAWDGVRQQSSPLQTGPPILGSP
jgi:hypothetical protein